MFGMLAESKVLQKTYIVKEKLGTGGYGEVYKALHKRLCKHYAIKVHSASKAETPDVHKNEAEALKYLKSLYVPQVFDFIADGKTSFTVMEYIEGESFDKLLWRNKKYERAEVMKWYYQLALALEEMHEKDICHRDIKPSNIMLTKCGDIRLIDFDAAIIKGKSVGSVNRSVGYASPEQSMFFNICKNAHEKRRKSIGAETCESKIKTHSSTPLKVAESRPPYRIVDWKLSDIFSLGATMYHLYTGRHPLKTENEFDSFPTSEGKIGVPEEIIKHSMQQKPSERFKSARELKMAIAKHHL